MGLELTCRASLVAPKMIHKAGFHPTAVLGAMGAAAAAGVALNLTKSPTCECAGHRRLDGRGDHRVPRRRHLDQAHASRLGGAVGHPCRGPCALGVYRAAHGVRRRARPVSRLRAHHQRPMGQAARRIWQALGHEHHRLQALSVRHHDASVHRLRAPPGARRSTSRTSRRSSARWRRARCTGCGSRSPRSSACRTPTPENSARLTASPAASCSATPGWTRSPRSGCATRASSRSPARCATRWTRITRTRTSTPGMSASE